jgi:hypothetical protein
VSYLSPSSGSRRYLSGIATALGHTEGGELVRRLYGHRDVSRALDRVAAAYEWTASQTQLRLV